MRNGKCQSLVTLGAAKPAIKLLSNKTQPGEGEVIQKGMGCDDQAYWENNHESSWRDKDIADSSQMEVNA